MVIRIPRIKINRPKWQGWINDVLKLIERANNFRVERGGPIWIREDDTGATIGFRLPLWWSFAVTTATVAGGTYGAPTTATVTLLRVVPGTPPTLTTTGGQSVTAYLPFGQSVASGKLCLVLWFAGFWWIVIADC